MLNGTKDKCFMWNCWQVIIETNKDTATETVILDEM